MNSRLRVAVVLVLFGLVGACTGSDMPLDTPDGAMDAGGDGATRDASADGGHDATSPHDAGTDAPMTEPDAATVDAATVDAATVDAATVDAATVDAATVDAATVDAFVDHCVGVTCTAADACHGVGTCDPTTGTCSSPSLTDGTTCDDANACTSPDACHAGVCTPGAAVVCTAADACHVAGTCSPASGCSTALAANGTTCPFATGAGGCMAGTCVSQCSDGAHDGAESDTDCGGACTACALGRTCGIDSDCASNACDAVSLACVASQCSDHRHDGAETDVDCGGGTCSACAVARGCSVNTDCSTNACDFVTATCATSACVDQRRDGSETDVDCGGGTCAACAVGKSCGQDADCMSNACDALALVCVANQCADRRHDGVETDIDCGGGICSACALAQRCGADSDCTTNACDGVSLTCVVSQCNDHRTDGMESDLDCGGLVCNPCTVGRHCNNSGDCQSGHACIGNSCQ